MSEKICAVVVTHNRLKLLKECIDAIRNQTRKLDEIIVVNNDSKDGTKEWLDEQKDLTIIHQENLGGAGGFHNGMKAAYNKGYDWIWCMDDDCVTKSNSLFELVSNCDKLENIGFLASKVVNKNQQVCNIPQIDKRSIQNGYKIWPQFLEFDALCIRESTFVSILIPSYVIRELGFPKKELFIWGDDYEYTYRITEKFNGYYIFKSIVLHNFNFNYERNLKSEQNYDRLWQYRYRYKNQMYILIKYKSFEYLIYYLFIKIPQELFLIYSQSKNKLYKTYIIFYGIFAGIKLSLKRK